MLTRRFPLSHSMATALVVLTSVCCAQAAETVLSPGAQGAVRLGLGNAIVAQSGQGTMTENKSLEGRALVLGGRTFGLGIGTHAPGEFVYHLDGGFRWVSFLAGIDSSCRGGSIVIQVWADGKNVYSSPSLIGGESPVLINAPIIGAKELKLVVTDGGDGDEFDHTNLCLAMVSNAKNAPELADLEAGRATKQVITLGKDGMAKPTLEQAARSLSGFEQARSNLSVSGNVLSVGGTTYTRGVGSHANGELVYNLDGSYQWFACKVGVDDEVTGGTVQVQVWADNKKIDETPVLSGGAQAHFLLVPIASVKTLALVMTDGGDDNANDHIDICVPTFFRQKNAPTPKDLK